MSADTLRRTSFPLAASLAALILTGLLLAFLFTTETPTGRVTGHVTIRETKAPLADTDIYLTPAVEKEKDPDMTTDAAVPVLMDDRRTHRRTHTDAEGRFSLLHVPTGKYTVSAVSRAHRSEALPVLVAEAKTATVEVSLKRSEPDLTVATHQQVFATSESLVLPIRGYVDARPNGAKDTIQVRVYQTRLSNVLRNGDAADALDRIGHTWEEPLPHLPASLLRPGADIPAPTLVVDRSLPITEADREGFFHKRIPLGIKGAGLFLIEVGHGKKSVTSWLLGTDTALVVKRAREQMITYTADLKTGKPVAGASIRHYWQGRVAASALSDANGIAALTVPIATDPDANRRRPLTVSVRGNDEAVLSRNNSFYEESGAYVVHAYTDRTIYRPGDTISYKAIVRRKDGTGYTVPRGVPVEIEVRDPTGERLVREAKATNSHGSFDGSLTLSPESPSGSYSVVTNVGGETYTSDITVASYRKPEFSVTVTSAKKRYVRGDQVEMTVEGKFYFGAPVAGAKVHYSVYRDSDWAAEYGGGTGSDSEDDEEASLGRESYGGYYGTTVLEGDVTLGDDGKATVSFPADVTAKGIDGSEENDDNSKSKTTAPEDVPQAQIYTLTASVTDNAQREVSGEGAARVSSGDYIVSVSPEGYLGTPNKASSIVVRTRDHNGKPVTGVPVTLTPSYSNWDEKNKEYKNEVLTPVTGTTGEDGTAILSVTPPRAGDLRMSAKATDKSGRDIFARSYLWVSSDSGGDMNTQYSDLSLLTDKRRYLPGETARVLVNTSRTGQTVL
ncbi:MAG: MG2 domain-containing protein, partial [Armatimonadota bacterium]